ncbi:recombination-associated protein RdgC [Spartinivicinus ruber]|uniref:recombination-associated protein RdgC n=1 Tax=Spartinivicinus ruber TaxID=2683272 RepID=UPI0013D41236|nr:recombination-associated protein RdgC [Spartinivicinus ruber]
MYENANVYQLNANADYVVERLLGGVRDAEFTPCGKYQELSYGFVPVKKGSYLEIRKKLAVFKVKLEKKILSPTVLRQRVIEAVEDHKDLTGERLTKQQIECLRKEIRTGLLPRAAKITTVVEVYIDTEQGFLVVNNQDIDVNRLFLQLFIQMVGRGKTSMTQANTVAA